MKFYEKGKQIQIEIPESIVKLAKKRNVDLEKLVNSHKDFVILEMISNLSELRENDGAILHLLEYKTTLDCDLFQSIF